MLPRLLILLTYASICVTNLLGGEPIISEFMASNSSGLRDEDGKNSDWIEIRNPDAVPVSLNGWYLTDDIANKQNWAFPNVTLPGNGYLVVFASGNNRRVPGLPLHTRFSLSADGEYLALVRPDGTTVTTEFAPGYPPQSPNVSYGTARPTQSLVLSDTRTPCRALVPTTEIGTAWRGRTFNDSTWTSGSLAVGYMTAGANPNLSSEIGLNVLAGMSGGNNSVYVRIPFTVSNPATVSRLVLRCRYDDGFAAFVNGNFGAQSATSPAPGSLNYVSRALGSHGDAGFEEFDLTQRVSDLVTGTNILAIHGLNVSNSSSDCFILPQLVAEISTGGVGQTGYFSVATPGAANGGNDTVQPPQIVAFSIPGGIYTTSQTVALTGAVAGQSIHYTLDGSTPNASTTLYTGPISVTVSRHIRARVVTSNGSLGRVSSAQYTFLNSNALSFTSRLPLLVIRNIDPLRQGDITQQDIKTACYAQLIDRSASGMATLNSQPIMQHRCGLSVRGSSSSGNEKRPFSLEFRNESDGDEEVAVLDMAANSDWVLLGPYFFDRTFIHDAFIYDVSRKVGRWASRTRFVEVFINTSTAGNIDYAGPTSSGYRGIYVLEERIKIGPERVNIEKVRPEDIAQPNVSGGYVFKIDRAGFDEFAWKTSRNIPADDPLVLVSLKNSEALQQQKNALVGYVQSFEDALYSANFASPTAGYAAWIDVGSWIDHHWLNVITKNPDALRLSSYFNKDRLQKIAAGPIWDFDRTLGSYDGRDADPIGWNGDTDFFNRDWWGRLFADPNFKQQWSDRWTELRRGPFATAALHATITEMAAEIGNDAAVRNYTRWAIFPDSSRGGTFTGEINALKTWVSSRMAWIDTQIARPPTVSVATGVVAAGTTVTLSAPSGSIYFRLDGLDPRTPGGGNSGALFSSSTPIAITSTSVLKARVRFADGSWSSPITAVYLVNEAFAVAGDLAISEINYHPLGATSTEAIASPFIDPEEFEYIELQNIGSRTVNLFELKFAEGKPFRALTLAPFTLTPGAFAIVVRSKAGFRVRHGAALAGRIAGEWSVGSLSNSTENIRLLARDGSVIQDFTYSDSSEWPGRADGKGGTLEYIGALRTDTFYNDPVNWRSSSEFHGTPAAAGAGPEASVVIHEVLNHAALPYVQAIELRNNTPSPIDVGNWYLSNTSAPESLDDFRQFRIPAGTTIQPGAYLVFDETDFNANGVWNPSRGIPSPGEFMFSPHRDNDCWLLRVDGAGVPASVVDRVEFGAARRDETWGRWPNGTGRLYPLVQQTLADAASGNSPKAKLGGQNSAPRVGPLLVSEIQHSPSNASPDLEFVEIRNIGNTTQAMANWRLRGDADFDFTTESLAAGGFLVLVPFAPTDNARAAAFRTAYQISNLVPLVGPWKAGDVLASTGAVTLYRAEAEPVDEPGFIPRTTEDFVNFRSSPPWPTLTTLGLSLTRRGVATHGNFGASWKNDVPTPGGYGVSYAKWNAFFFPGGGLGSQDADDFDTDGAGNNLEFTQGSDPRFGEGRVGFNPRLTQPGGPGGSTHLFTYTVALDRLGTVYQPEQSPDLITWSDSASSLISTDGDRETRQVSITISGGLPDQLFFRVRTTTAQ